MKKRVKILLWILWILVLLWAWVYCWIKVYKANHQVVCRIEQGWDCPEWIDKCYEEMHAWYDTTCPAKNEHWGCEYKEVEVCK